MHGGKAGAPKGNKNRLIHGHYTAKAIAERRYNTQVLRQLRAILESIG